MNIIQIILRCPEKFAYIKM